MSLFYKRHPVALLYVGVVGLCRTAAEGHALLMLFTHPDMTAGEAFSSFICSHLMTPAMNAALAILQAINSPLLSFLFIEQSFLGQQLLFRLCNQHSSTAWSASMLGRKSGSEASVVRLRIVEYGGNKIQEGAFFCLVVWGQSEQKPHRLLSIAANLQLLLAMDCQIVSRIANVGSEDMRDH